MRRSNWRQSNYGSEPGNKNLICLSCFLDHRDKEAVSVEHAGNQPQETLSRETGSQPLCAGGGENAIAEHFFYSEIEGDRMCARELRERSGDNLVVLFGLQRAGGVDHTPARADSAHG